MKIALCLTGLVGTDDKYGIGSKVINYKIGQKHFKKHVIDVNDEVDVYIHSWSTDYESRLLEAYSPVSYEFEEQPFFSNDPRQQAIHCRWLSMRKVMELVKQSGEQYDFILFTRFDIAFLVDFDFKMYDNSKFYAQGPAGPYQNGIQLINDLWFFGTPEKIFKFSTLFDHLTTSEYIPYLGSSHELCRKHLIATGLQDDLEYIFKREWNGPMGKTTTETPLIRWHYLRKI
jgi:hypothetical protein